MKIIVAGSRNIKDTKETYGFIYRELNRHKHLTLISGAAQGADRLGERVATDMGVNVLKFPAEWDKHGKKAGILRNIEMSKEADMLIALWDGKSRGTRHMIQAMLDLKKQVIVYWPQGENLA